MPPKSIKKQLKPLTSSKSVNEEIKKKNTIEEIEDREDSDIDDTTSESDTSSVSTIHKGGNVDIGGDFDENIEDDENDDDNEDKNDDEDVDEDEDEGDDEDKGDDEDIVDKGDEKGEDDDCVYSFSKKKKKKQFEDKDDDVCEEDDFSDDEDVGKNVYVSKDDMITTRKLTKYEYVNIVGTRAKQISMGAQSMIQNTGNLNPKEIAKLELRKKVCPIILIRTLPSGEIEKIDVNTLIFDFK
jgi:DNA-directed RNA polymerase subunit K/omega